MKTFGELNDEDYVFHLEVFQTQYVARLYINYMSVSAERFIHTNEKIRKLHVLKQDIFPQCREELHANTKTFFFSIRNSIADVDDISICDFRNTIQKIFKINNLHH